MTMAKRLKGMGSAKYQNDGDPRTSGPGFGLTVHEGALRDPLKWRKPSKVFVNSMSDLFHADVPDEFLAKVFAVMAAAPQHTFQILTKRHARMRSLLNSENFAEQVANEMAALWKVDSVAPLRGPLPNVWLGVSVEDQRWADIRIPALLETPAAVRFLSCEPLLGPVKLPLINEVEGCTCGGSYCGIHERGCGLEPGPAWGNLHWVIVGGESGPKARPMHLSWVRSLRDQCTDAGVPFFFKQHGAWAPWASHLEGEDGPGDTFVNPDGDTGHVWFNENLGYPTNCTRNWGEHSQIVSRVGKKHAGRLLDGRTWDEYPQPAEVPA
jgi:protein gp37